jgi:hypothetical protein
VNGTNLDVRLINSLPGKNGQVKILTNLTYVKYRYIGGFYIHSYTPPNYRLKVFVLPQCNEGQKQIKATVISFKVIFTGL